MRRWQTLSALAAVALASIGSIRAVPMHGMMTAFAIVVLAIVGLSLLLEAVKGRPKSTSGFNAGERARMIRERRGKRR